MQVLYYVPPSAGAVSCCIRRLGSKGFRIHNVIAAAAVHLLSGSPLGLKGGKKMKKIVACDLRIIYANNVYHEKRLPLNTSNLPNMESFSPYIISVWILM